MKLKVDAMKASIPEYGFSIATDGWTSPAQRPLMNIMVVTHAGAFFHDSIDTSECETPNGKDAAFVADFIIKNIEEIGPEHVVSVVTDGASVMKAAWARVTARFPTVKCTWCAAHVLNLLCENIGKMAFFKDEIDIVKDIIKFVKNHEWTRKELLRLQAQLIRYFIHACCCFLFYFPYHSSDLQCMCIL